MFSLFGGACACAGLSFFCVLSVYARGEDSVTFFLISLQVPMSIEVSALFNCKSPGKYLIFGC